MKRVFDLVVGLLLVPIFGIPFSLVAFGVRVFSKGPAIYWSDRVGRDKSF